MQTVTVHPLAVSQTVTVSQSNNWNTGICDCCDDCGICCCALWCFPCLQCKTVNDFKECLCLPLLDPFWVGYCGCGTACPPISMAMRASVRERYRISGSICDDCCMLCWCYSCSWCQMAREIKKRKQPITFMTAQTTSVQMPLQHILYPQM
ncbi:placenta-specific gene 8 protein-like [Xenopus laevis]|uniref:Placenta-specific gene 8 protein-like n=1 Tax=Xenopus laevis TaxID=8355 RepID=A0A8J1MV86_XENLA|nr:placenta-specific gene 8 protein-like [Xenopus laevis]